MGTPSGTYLVRVAESRFGYSLSLSSKNTVKHFMVDNHVKTGEYMVYLLTFCFYSLI